MKTVMKIDPEESSIAAHIIPGVYLSGISRGGGEGGGGCSGCSSTPLRLRGTPFRYLTLHQQLLLFGDKKTKSCKFCNH